MPIQKFMRRLKLDEAEIQSRRAYFEITDEDLARLARLRPMAEKHTDAIVEDLYELILNNEESRRLFDTDQLIAHVKKAQRDYFLGLFAGRCDVAYVEDRLRIGLAHERVGVPPKLYIGAYSRYRRAIYDRMERDIPDRAEFDRAYRAIEKLIAFDVALAMDTYIEAHMETVAMQQAAIKELSTPVIRLHDRILLMPLIGTIDTARAEQIMEAILDRVVADKAQVIILDIAGVPVVDTTVADHLLKTTAAVRLLGARTILTGISSTLAKTMVRLGVEISSMETRSRLDDGVELALRLVGKEIVTRLEHPLAPPPQEGGHAGVSGEVPVLRVGENLLVTIQGDLHDTSADLFQENVLSAITATGAKGLVVDISALDIVDTYVARVLVTTGQMAKLMGIETVLVGMRPYVAATLIRMGFQIAGVHTALDVDHGLALLAQLHRKH